MTVRELNHVAIHVCDVEASCEFYRNVLQLEPMVRLNRPRSFSPDRPPPDLLPPA